MPHSSLCSLTYFHDLHHPSIQCFSHVFSFPILLSTQSSFTKTWRMDLVIDPSTKKTHHSSIQCFSHSLSLHPMLLPTQSLSTHNPSLPILLSTQSSLTTTVWMNLVIHPNTKRAHRPSIQCFYHSLSLPVLPSTHSSLTKTVWMGLVIHPNTKRTHRFPHPVLLSTQSSLTTTVWMDLLIRPKFEEDTSFLHPLLFSQSFSSHPSLYPVFPH